MPRAPAAGPEDLQAALCALARAIADSLDLKEVWDRVATACRLVVSFDAMGISRFETPDRIRVHATVGDPDGRLEEIVFTRADFSPGLRPEEMGVLILQDAQQEMDPSFRLDRMMLERHCRSLL